MTVALVSDTQRWVGLSSDSKPAAAAVGSTFYETDSGLTSIWDGAAFQPQLGAGVGGLKATKTVTFTGAATLGAVGNVPIFTVTGSVEIVSLTPLVTVNLGEAAPTATIALGFVGTTSFFVAATGALAQLTAGKIWFTATPAALPIAIPAGFKNIWTNANLVGTVAAQAVNAGAIRFDVYWRPVSANGLLVAS